MKKFLSFVMAAAMMLAVMTPSVQASVTPSANPAYKVPDFTVMTTPTGTLAAITGLAVVDIPLENSVLLEWVAPNAGGSWAWESHGGGTWDGFPGYALGYDVRYSSAPITAANWASATQADMTIVPNTPGVKQTFMVNALETGQQYYFAIRYIDCIYRESPVSANVTATPNAPSETVDFAVGNMEVLVSVINNANPKKHTVITLAAGNYTRYSEILLENKYNITIQGATSSYDDTVIRGNSTIMIKLNNSSYITIKNLTLRDNGQGHAVQANAGSNYFHADNLKTWNNGESGFKATSTNWKPNQTSACSMYADYGLIENCYIGFDVAGWTSGAVEGHDGVAVRGWTIRNSRFENIKKPNGHAYAIFNKGNSFDTVMEGNILINCDIGLSFGGGGTGPVELFRYGDATYEHRGGVMRNNIVWGTKDVGIAVLRSIDFEIYNNTVYGQNSYESSIDTDYRVGYAGYAEGKTSSGIIRNNLLEKMINYRTDFDKPGFDLAYTASNNVVVGSDDVFEGSPQGVTPAFDANLELVESFKPTGASVLNAGMNLYAQGVTTDIDGMPRPDSRPFDVGAYQVSVISDEAELKSFKIGSIAATALGTAADNISGVAAGAITIERADDALAAVAAVSTGATMKMVKYAAADNTSGFDTDSAYAAGETIANGDFFIIRIVAESGDVTKYYRVNATVNPAVDSVVVVTQPLVNYTAGERLNLDALAVEVQYDDATSDQVSFAAFADAGLTASPAHSMMLDDTIHDGMPITITHTKSGKTVDTYALYVSPSALEKSETPVAVNATVRKMTVVQAAVSFELSNAPALVDEWAVYDAQGVLMPSVTATFADPMLTLTHASNLPSGVYYVAMTETGKREGNSVALTVENLAEYDIVYELNGGTNAANAPTSYVEGVGVTLPVATKAGLIFGGWYQQADFSDTAITEIDAAATGDVTLYAKWDAITYTVTFHMNDGTSVVYATRTVVENTSMGASLPSAPTRTDGYTFKQWTTMANGTGLLVNATRVITANIDVYAQWATPRPSTTPTPTPTPKPPSGGGPGGGGPDGPEPTPKPSESASPSPSASASPAPSKDPVVRATEMPNGTKVNSDDGKTLIVNEDGSIALRGAGTIVTKNGTEVSGSVGTSVDANGVITSGSNGMTVKKSDAEEATKIPAGVSLRVDGKAPLGFVAVDLAFEDVEPSDWFFNDAAFVYIDGMMGSTSTQTMRFSPQTAMSRGMLVTVLHTLAGNPAAANSDFADVAADAWYADAVSWAKAKDLVAGTGLNRFSPEASITRQDLAVILVRYAKSIGVELPTVRDSAAFADAANISDYAAAAVEALYRADIVGGKLNNRFDPTGQATRAEVASMLRRFVEIVEAQ